MTPLEKILLELIHRGGPLPFAAYMSLALYHPRHGYYAGTTPRTGWRGHFVTSPELHPVFGRLWARAFYDVWEAAGSPSRFHIVELGPGEGSFARAVHDSLEPGLASAVRYHLVERVPAAEHRQRAMLDGIDNMSWGASLEEITGVTDGCIFANEVLDNLPVHLVEMRAGKLHEVHVGMAEDGTLGTLLAPPSTPALEAFLQRHDIHPRDGERHEIGLAAETLAQRTADAIDRGAVVFVDYGAEAPELAGLARTLATYSAAGAGDDPIAHPGERDITAHVNWTAVKHGLRRGGLNPLLHASQNDVLRSLGADELEDRCRADHAAAVAEGRGVDAVAALSELQALGTLLDRAGLGSFDVVMATKGIESPRFVRRIATSSRRDTRPPYEKKAGP